MAVYIGPFAHVTRVHFPDDTDPTPDVWVIIEGSNGIADVNYAGEADFTNASSSARASTGFGLYAGPFTTEAAALAAWAPFDGTSDPGTNWHQLLHWINPETDGAAPPIEYDDPDWLIQLSSDGYCGYGAYFGRLGPPGNTAPDPNCPPEVLVNVAIAWATGGGPPAYLAYQQSLTTVHNSFTAIYVPYGGAETELSCTPGTP